jgi:hypothetical protein
MGPKSTVQTGSQREPLFVQVTQHPTPAVKVRQKSPYPLLGGLKVLQCYNR